MNRIMKTFVVSILGLAFLFIPAEYVHSVPRDPKYCLDQGFGFCPTTKSCATINCISSSGQEVTLPGKTKCSKSGSKTVCQVCDGCSGKFVKVGKEGGKRPGPKFHPENIPQPPACQTPPGLPPANQ